MSFLNQDVSEYLHELLESGELLAADASLSLEERAALRECMERSEAEDKEYLDRLGPFLVEQDRTGEGSITDTLVRLYREDHGMSAAARSLLDDLVSWHENKAGIARARADELLEDEVILRRAVSRLEHGDAELSQAWGQAAVDFGVGHDHAVWLRQWFEDHPGPDDGRAPGKTEHIPADPRSGESLVATGKREVVVGEPDGGVNLVELGDQAVNRPILPALLPELRVHLRGMWDEGRPFNMVAPQMGHGPTSGPDAVIKWEQHALDRCSLWWVAADMVEVLLAAAASVPDDVQGRDLAPLDTCGLVALERPWEGTSSTPGQRTVKVDAFLWGPTILQPLGDQRPDLPPDEGIPAVSLSAYSCFPPARGLASPIARKYALDEVLWAPLGRSDWPLVDELDRAPWPMEEQTRQSFAEDRRILCALMTLLAHAGVAETRTGYASRGVRRRLERAHGKRDNSFRIVTLRTLRDPGEEKEEGAGQGTTRDHRWIVSGHWRRQPYGRRDLNLRRLQWIHPHVKGPEDAPIKMKEVIHAWRR